MPVLLHERREALQDRARIRGVLEDVGEEEQIEAAIAERRPQRLRALDVSDEHLVEHLLRPLDRRGDDLDPGHARAGALGRGAVEADAAADVEHGARPPEERAERPVLLLDEVLGPRRGRGALVTSHGWPRRC